MGRLHVTLAKALGAGRSSSSIGRGAVATRRAVGADLCVLDSGTGLEGALAGDAAAAHSYPTDGFDVVIVTSARRLRWLRDSDYWRQQVASTSSAACRRPTGTYPRWQRAPLPQPSGTRHHRRVDEFAARAIELLAAGVLNTAGL